LIEGREEKDEGWKRKPKKKVKKKKKERKRERKRNKRELGSRPQSIPQLLR
jgi:hypothetical protein